MKIQITLQMVLEMIVFTVIIISSLFLLPDDIYCVYIFPALVLVALLIILTDYRKRYGFFLNFDSLFIIMLWTFGMSRSVTYWFGFNSYVSVYGKYTIQEYCKAYLFTFLCMSAYYLFSCLNFKKYDYDSFTLGDFDDKTEKFLYIILAVCLVPMLWYYYRLISVASSAAYGTREYSGMINNTGYLISLLREWGVLTLIILVAINILGKKRHPQRVFIYGLYGLVMVLSLLSGSRSEGISMFLIFLMIYTIAHREKISMTRCVIVLIGLVIMISLIPYLFRLRRDISQVSNGLELNVGINSILKGFHEMGGSESPLLIVQNSEQGYRFGQSIFLAIINSIVNFLPSSIRPDFSVIGPISLASSFSRFLNLNYGLGFSLFAEAFLNFGWLGSLLFGVLALIAGKILHRKKNSADIISGILFVYIMLTMPRRESKDLFTALLYYWLPFEILMHRLIRRKY